MSERHPYRVRLDGYGTLHGRWRDCRCRLTRTVVFVRCNDVAEEKYRRSDGMKPGKRDPWSGWTVSRDELERLFWAERGVVPPVHEWRPAAGFPGYEVSNSGAIRTSDGHTSIARVAGRDGYQSARMGGRKVPVHRVVLETFAGPPPDESAHCRHLNGDPADNRVENLAWGTAAENATDRERHDRTARGDPKRQGQDQRGRRALDTEATSQGRDVQGHRIAPRPRRQNGARHRER